MGKPRQIMVLGGGGFLAGGRCTEPERVLLRLSGKARPRVCFLGAAGGDAHADLDRFYAAFEDVDATHVSLFSPQRVDLPRRLAGSDVIYLGGGNVANLLALLRVHGLDSVLRDAWSRGVTLAGVSAGASALFDDCLTDALGLPLRPLRDGLGLLPGSFCPHYGRGKRGPRYRQLVAQGGPDGLSPGIGLGDDTAVHFVDATPVAVFHPEVPTAVSVTASGHGPLACTGAAP